MNIYDFVRETRSIIIDRVGYQEGYKAVGMFVCTIIQWHGSSTPERVASHVIELHRADLISADAIIYMFKG